MHINPATNNNVYDDNLIMNNVLLENLFFINLFINLNEHVGKFRLVVFVWIISQIGIGKGFMLIIIVNQIGGLMTRKTTRKLNGRKP